MAMDSTASFSSNDSLPCATSPTSIRIVSPRRSSRSVYCNHGQLCTLEETADDAQNILLDVKYGVEESGDGDPETDTLEVTTDTETESSGGRRGGSGEIDPRASDESIETEFDTGEKLKQEERRLYEELDADGLLAGLGHIPEVCTTLASSQRLKNGSTSTTWEYHYPTLSAQSSHSALQPLIRRSSTDSGYFSVLDHVSAKKDYRILSSPVDRQIDLGANSFHASPHLKQLKNNRNDGGEEKSSPYHEGHWDHMDTDQTNQPFHYGGSAMSKPKLPLMSNSQTAHSSASLTNARTKDLQSDDSKEEILNCSQEPLIDLASKIQESGTSPTHGRSLGSVSLPNPQTQKPATPEIRRNDFLLHSRESLFNKFFSNTPSNWNKIDPQVPSAPLSVFYYHSNVPLTPSATVSPSPEAPIRPHTRGIARRIPRRNMSKAERKLEEKVWMKSMEESESDTESEGDGQRKWNGPVRKRKRGPTDGDDDRAKGMKRKAR